MELTFDEKKEIIIDSFCRTFDKELSYMKVKLSAEEYQILETDSDFQDRLLFYLIQEREQLITDIKLSMNSPKEEVALKAAIAYGKLIYREKFTDKEEDKGLPRRLDVNIINSPRNLEKELDETAEVLSILEGSGVFQPKLINTTKAKTDGIHSTQASTETSSISVVKMS